MRIKIVLFLFVLLSLNSHVWAGDYLNQHLPSQVKMDAEFRYRMEYKDNYDFDIAKEDKDAYNLFRTRISLKYNPIKPVSFFIQGQDARVSNLSTGTKSLMQNLWDIRQLYAKYEDEVLVESIGLNKVLFQAGRQEFAYGAERLMGGFNWSNVAQTFDGGKAAFHFSPMHLHLDFFAGDKTAFRTPQQPAANMFYTGASKDRVYGYYASVKVLHETLIENYLIHRMTWKNISFGPSGSGEIDDYTFGGRIKKKFSNGIDYEVEAAGQWGNFRDKAVRAMMMVGILGYTFDHKWSPRMAVEFDYGSGDSDSTDNTMRTFDNLYPTNHSKYGNMDLMSLQNINAYRYSFSIKPHKKVKLQADLLWLYLDTPKDSLYSAGRTVSRTIPAGRLDVGDHLGKEVDLTADYKLNNYVSFQTGYSHLFPGAYLKNTGANNDADFLYFQTIVSF